MSLHFINSWLEILLVVTDPERLRLGWEELRTERGIVHVARDGAEVLSLLRGDGSDAVRPNAVILDISLPESEWPEVAAGIVEAELDVPVIAIDWLETKGAGVPSGVGEPPSEESRAPGELTRRIRRALVDRRTEDELAAALRNEQLIGAVAEQEADPAEAPDTSRDTGVRGSALGIGRSMMHLTLNDEGEAQLLAGLQRFRALSERMRNLQPREHDGSGTAAGRLPASARPRDLIEEVAARYEPAAQVKGVVLRGIEDDYAPRITVDLVGLSAALGALVAYTLHLAASGRRVEVSGDAVSGDRAVSFGVRSDGPGIAEHFVPLLADPFATVAPIVEAHGAWLSFWSTARKGFSFSFTLPESMCDSFPWGEYEDEDAMPADESGAGGSA